MEWFYIIALIPLLAGGCLWLFNKEVTWLEWLGGSLVAFIFAGMFHAIAFQGMTDDRETWSGRITEARQYSAWKEYYEEAVYRTEYYYVTESYTDSDGKRRTRRVQKSRRVFDHWDPETRWHREHFGATSDIGTSHDISKEHFEKLCKLFNNHQTIPGRRRTSEHNSRMIDGDPNDYVTSPVNGYIEPVTKWVHFENRIKASPTVFSFIKVPTNIAVYPYPNNTDPFSSDRVIGEARKLFSVLEWDQLNARLGALKKVNLIIVGFPSQHGIGIAEYQRAKWIGGRKNDLVICYGTDWCKVFGWTESELVKKNLESLFLSIKPVRANKDRLLTSIEAEVKHNYVKKDWHKFDYIRIQPRTGHLIWYVCILAITQSGLYIFFHMNQFGKNLFEGNFLNRLVAKVSEITSAIINKFSKKNK